MRGLAFQSTTEVLANPEPFTVNVKSPVPAGVADGESELRLGTPPVISNVKALEVPPPGEGLNTVTEALPVLATSEAVIEAVNWVALTNVVVRLEPFHRTTELEMKEEPVTVSVKSASPAFALVGLSDVILGTGFCGVGVPPPPPPPQLASANVKTATPRAASPMRERIRVVFGRITVTSL